MMKLSIVTVNRNDAQGLSHTLSSVWEKQTFQNIEHIVIDGGSTDDSVAVIRQYADKLSYWVSEPDNGVYNAMNKGILRATGDYLLFLNSGDWLKDDCLSQAFCNLFSEDIVYGNLVFYRSRASFEEYIYPDTLSATFLLKYSLGHPSTFIKRDLFDTCLYNENYRIVSDWAFWVKKILLENCSTKHLDQTISFFNMHGISSDEENKSLVEKEKTDFLANEFPMPLWELYRERERLYHTVDTISKHKVDTLVHMQWIQKTLRLFAKPLFVIERILRKN